MTIEVENLEGKDRKGVNRLLKCQGCHNYRFSEEECRVCYRKKSEKKLENLGMSELTCPRTDVLFKCKECRGV